METRKIHEERGVLLLGVGGLGCAAALLLVAAGVRRLGLVDDDRVSLSNLHRQILFRMTDIGMDKVTQAGQRLREQQPDCQVEQIPRRLTERDAIGEVAAEYAVVIDGSDNFTTRFAANDAAVAYRFPLVHGAATGGRGQLCSIAAGGQPCLRCLFGGPPTQNTATCRSEGVFGPLVGEVGGLMALEAIKWLHGSGQPLLGRLLTIDVTTAKRRIVPLRSHPQCPVCAPHHANIPDRAAS
ncbi:MAG: HesA/MoeB/ThiF family protein [Magnetococcales bacterium]|nr:HesA/MoeB/ThiF family protein [Magnetococcales bacterium]